MINWYEQLPKDNTKPKRDKNFKAHLIEPCSMILCLGGTGAGKTNALVDFLSKKNDSFCDIIIFSGSTTEEPLYEFLKKKIPEIQLFNDIEEVPPLSSFEDDKTHQKLLVVDDFINLRPKEFQKIKEYLTSGRKYGFTVFLMCQNYRECPKTITRNINYFVIFHLNDNISIDNILRNHNVFDIDKAKVKALYQDATKERLNFFVMDLKNKEFHLRKNWTHIYPIEEIKPSNEFSKKLF